VARKKKKPIENYLKSPRMRECEFCKKQFNLNGFGWSVNGNGALFCSCQCHWENYQRSERIRKGEATWKDL